MIIETLSNAICDQKQSECHAKQIIDCAAKGCPIVNGEIVPINAVTGQPDYTAQRTVRWDFVQVSPDDTRYIQDYSTASLTGSPEWDYTRRSLPLEWIGVIPEAQEFTAQYDTEHFQ